MTTRAERDDFLAHIPEAAVCGIYVYDLVGGRNEYINPAYTAITGWTLEELERLSADGFFELFHPDDRAAVAAHIDAVIGSEVGIHHDVEYRFRHRDGNWIWCLSRDAALEHAPDGSVSRYLGTFLDITQRKQAEERLVEGRRRIEAAIDHGEVGIWSWNLADDELELDPAAERILAQDDGLIDFDRLIVALHPDDREVARDRIRRAIGDGDRIDLQVRVDGGDGPARHVRLRAAIQRDESGAATQVSGVLIDLTDHVQLQERMHRQDKLAAVGKLAGGVAHDFSNQLTVILGCLELLDQPMPEERREKCMRNIRTAVDRSIDLTARMLAISREGPRVDGDQDLGRMIGDLEAMLGYVIDRRIEIGSRVDVPAGIAAPDPAELHKALLSLCMNACDAMPEGGRLTIHADLLRWDGASADLWHSPSLTPGTYLRLGVIDTGIGIEPGVLAHLERHSASARGGGGLAMIQRLAERHGGGMQVESLPGIGTTVDLLLPVDEADQSIAAADPGGGTILVVDDEEGIRFLLERILGDEGYRVLLAGDGEQAEAIYRDRWREIDLVLVDMIMPKVDGRETWRRMHAINPAVRVLIVSGRCTPEDVDAIIEQGGLGVVLKPFAAADVLEPVREAMMDLDR